MQHHTLDQSKHHHVKLLLDYMLGGGVLPDPCIDSTYIITNGYEITSTEYIEIVNLANSQLQLHPRNTH